MNIFSKTKLKPYWPNVTATELHTLLLNPQNNKTAYNHTLLLVFTSSKIQATYTSLMHFYRRNYLVEARQELINNTKDAHFYSIYFCYNGDFYIVKRRLETCKCGLTYYVTMGLTLNDALPIALFLNDYRNVTLHRVSASEVINFNHI